MGAYSTQLAFISKQNILYPPILYLEIHMSHTIRDQAKLVSRVRRLKGQMEAVERALEAERPCGEILQLLASIRGALTGLTGEILEDHLEEHVLEAESDAARRQAVAEISGVLKTYLR
jgi:DNA-binding FrmR family transcriptional regulator